MVRVWLLLRLFTKFSRRKISENDKKQVRRILLVNLSQKQGENVILSRKKRVSLSHAQKFLCFALLRNQNQKQTFDDVEAEEDIDVNEDEIITSWAVGMINHANASRNNSQSPFQNASISDSTTSQAQTNQYFLYAMNSLNHAQKSPKTDHHWMYSQYSAINTCYSFTQYFHFWTTQYFISFSLLIFDYVQHFLLLKSYKTFTSSNHFRIIPFSLF